jgi:hypothetical protein
MPRKRAEEVFLYTFYVALFDIQPVIWRRFSVPSNITFEQFHEVLQLVMGWDNYHLYSFKYGPVEIGVPDDEDDDIIGPGVTFLPAQGLSLQTLHFEADDVMTYTYDFGDNWVHLLRLEFISALEKGTTHAFRCEDGARACPPEDVGGTYGYALHLKTLADPTDPEYEETLNWRGPYDPNEFDLEFINEQLQAEFGGKAGKAKGKTKTKDNGQDEIH